MAHFLQCRWPMKIFQSMLDIGALNAYIIWKMHQLGTHSAQSVPKSHITRRRFLRSVREGLMGPLISRRAQLARTKHVQRSIDAMGYGDSPAHIPPGQRRQRVKIERSRKCVTCLAAGKRTNSNTGCNNCHKPLCRPHRDITILCDTCVVKLSR